MRRHFRLSAIFAIRHAFDAAMPLFQPFHYARHDAADLRLSPMISPPPRYYAMLARRGSE
jgi:hypothetical protein